MLKPDDILDHIEPLLEFLRPEWAVDRHMRALMPTVNGTESLRTEGF